MSNKDKIMAKIESDLNLYASYEDKHKYLTNHKYLDRAYEKYPELKNQVNEIMVSNIIDEFGQEPSELIGSPDESQFKLSKTMSNKELLRNLNMSDLNKEYLEDFKFQTDSPELVKQLQSLNLISPEDVIYDDKKKISGGTIRGLDTFDALIKLKNEEFAPIKKEKASNRLAKNDSW